MAAGGALSNLSAALDRAVSPEAVDALHARAARVATETSLARSRAAFVAGLLGVAETGP
jgi:hypothetical protein